MVERRHPRLSETLDEIELIDRLTTLTGFDRAMLRYGRVLAATGGITLKTLQAATVSSVDTAFNYLKKINAVDWDSGKSTNEVAKATGYKRTSISTALNRLAERGIIKAERRGRQIKYYLAT